MRDVGLVAVALTLAACEPPQTPSATVRSSVVTDDAGSHEPPPQPPANATPIDPNQDVAVHERLASTPDGGMVAVGGPVEVRVPIPFPPVSLKAWRAAAETYVPSVADAIQVPMERMQELTFRTYLNRMHVRIHSQFADGFVASLSPLPREDPLSDPSLVTRLEIVLKRDGTIDKMGVVKSSGSLAFDVGVLASVDRAKPFRPVPPTLLSSDGKMYVQWKFHREETLACNAMQATPYVLDFSLRSPSP